jgi:hypothetical protein
VKPGLAPELGNAQRSYKHKDKDQKEGKQPSGEPGQAKEPDNAMHSGATSTKRRFTRKEINPQNSRASSGDKQCAAELQAPRNGSQGRTETFREGEPGSGAW